MTTLADMLCNESSPAIQCECGITWFTSQDEDCESLLEKAKSETNFRYSSEDAIGWGWFEGCQRVWGCPKCMERIERCEKWILDNEELIRGFLKQYGQDRLEEAKRLSAIE